MIFVENDGGRAAAGFKGQTGDCVTRAIAIALAHSTDNHEDAGETYRSVYDALFQSALNDRPHMAKLQLRYGKNARRHASPRDGMSRRIYERYLLSLGWKWTPTMKVGQGCTVHLRADELPQGRLVVAVSKHLTAVIDGVIHDTHDPSRGGTRCVYGYYSRND